MLKQDALSLLQDGLLQCKSEFSYDLFPGITSVLPDTVISVVF